MGLTGSAWHVFEGDCRTTLSLMEDASVQCCVTSPPYFGLRDYGHAGQIGLESTPDEFVARPVEVFREVRRVLKDDGTLWLNLGDSYAGGGGGNYNKTGKTQAGGQHVTGVRNRPGSTVVTRGTQAQRPHRHPLAGCPGASGRWLVVARPDHLGQGRSR